MSKISQLTPLAEEDVDGTELAPVSKDGQTFGAPIEYLGRRAAVRAEAARDIAIATADFPTLAAAQAAFPGSLSEGETFSYLDGDDLMLRGKIIAGVATALPGPYLSDDKIGTIDGTDLGTALTNRELVINVHTFGAVGDCVPLGNKAVKGLNGPVPHDDTQALTDAINALWNLWARYISRVQTQWGGQIPVGGPRLTGLPGKVYYYTSDLPPFPPGCHLDMSGCAMVPGNDNIRAWWTRGGGVQAPNLDPDKNDGEGLDIQYGSVGQRWHPPAMHCNGRAGTFVQFDTLQHGEIGTMEFYDATGSSYTVSGALVTDSRFVGLAPADYAKVKKGDVLNLGDADEYGNPQKYLVADKRVINAGATNRTYGKLKLDRFWRGASGNVNITQHSFPWVTQKMQQMVYVGRRRFLGCDWEAYHGRNADELPMNSGGAWDNETVTLAYGFNDQDYGEHFAENSKYGTVFGPWSADFTAPIMSQQFVREGSQLFIDCIDAKFGDIRHEIEPSITEANRSKPCIVVGPGSKAYVDRHRVNVNATGKFFGGISTDAELTIGTFETLGGDIPAMPDGSRAPYVKPGATGLLLINGARGMNGPTIGGIAYRQNPRAWAGDGANGPAPFGYAGVQKEFFRQTYYSSGGEHTYRPLNGSANSLVQHKVGDAFPNFAVQGNGALLLGTGSGGFAGEIKAVGTSMFYTAYAGVHVFQGAIWLQDRQVLTTRRPSLPPDATDLASAIALVNALKAGVKATGGHGLFED